MINNDTVKSGLVINVLTKNRVMPKMVIDKITEIESDKNPGVDIFVDVIYTRGENLIKCIEERHPKYYVSEFKSDSSALAFMHKHGVIPVSVQYDDRYFGHFTIYSDMSAAIEMSNFNRFIVKHGLFVDGEPLVDKLEYILWNTPGHLYSGELTPIVCDNTIGIAHYRGLDFCSQIANIMVECDITMSSDDILNKLSKSYKSKSGALIILNENYNVLELEKLFNVVNKKYHGKVSIATLSRKGMFDIVENVVVYRDTPSYEFSDSSNMIKIINKIL